jgi:hypothetical protein
MKRSNIAPLSLAALLVATPVAASPALILGAVALATAVGVSASHQPYEAWQYTEKFGRLDVSQFGESLATSSRLERGQSECKSCSTKRQRSEALSSAKITSGADVYRPDEMRRRTTFATSPAPFSFPVLAQ